MKTRTTIYVNERLMELARAGPINVSEVCETALEKATGFHDAVTLAGRILALKADIRLLTDIIEETDNIQDGFEEMRATFENRHTDDGRWKTGPTEQQDRTWIRATKGKYGLGSSRVDDLYRRLNEAIA